MSLRLLTLICILSASALSGCGTSSKQQRSPSASIDRASVVTYRVPSGSMLPTLKVDQVIRVDSSAYARARPAEGDIIVFHPPHGADVGARSCQDPHQGLGHSAPCSRSTPARSSQKYIKRIVGGSGDRLSIIDGHVLRNGVREKDAYTAPCRGGYGCTFRRSITVPRGMYFVLGDNRGLSDDSRFWGPIRKAWIVGKVVG